MGMQMNLKEVFQHLGLCHWHHLDDGTRSYHIWCCQMDQGAFFLWR